MRQPDHRNEATKARLVGAFRALCQRKGVSHVSISDITRECRCNRNTFYYHFEDIRALLNWMFEQDLVAVTQSLKDGDVHSLIASAMAYMDANRALIRDVFENLGTNSLDRAFAPCFQRTIGEIVRKCERDRGVQLDARYRAFVVNFFCEAVGGMMLAYVRSFYDYQGDELIRLLTEAIEKIPLFITNGPVE